MQKQAEKYFCADFWVGKKPISIKVLEVAHLKAYVGLDNYGTPLKMCVIEWIL